MDTNLIFHNLGAEMEQLPRSRMNDVDWEEIEIRAEERDEFSRPCAICRDELGCRAHVSIKQVNRFYRLTTRDVTCFAGFLNPLCQ